MARQPDIVRGSAIWWIRVLLRLAGGFIVLAFLAMLMPARWMAATHRYLGMGELPQSPAVEYLARSISALYGFHGVLLLIIASDPARYRALVTYVAVMNVVFGLLILAIDLEAGMPALWTAFEGPPVAAFGLALGALNRRAAQLRGART